MSCCCELRKKKDAVQSDYADMDTSTSSTTITPTGAIPMINAKGIQRKLERDLAEARDDAGDGVVDDRRSGAPRRCFLFTNVRGIHHTYKDRLPHGVNRGKHSIRLLKLMTSPQSAAGPSSLPLLRLPVVLKVDSCNKCKDKIMSQIYHGVSGVKKVEVNDPFYTFTGDFKVDDILKATEKQRKCISVESFQEIKVEKPKPKPKDDCCCCCSCCCC
ncbi:hypothetical protein SELMODRAFT_421676 [Selaginella moellendorffii]|uniref:HMA domain-containing protein n=1 Tax=Selaginella moellendorffii TaxID=88036 RepID=D8SG08_SELML|nr:hypothetical protein SELMODRAFT_421676 [Selaginella moellendorffii]